MSVDLLHDMGPGEAGEVAESIGAVHDRVSRRHFGIAKHKVAVWRKCVVLMWEGFIEKKWKKYKRKTLT